MADLPHSAPSDQGVDAARVTAFLDALEAAPQIEPHSVILVRHGHVVAQGWWAPYSAQRRHLLYSVSKSFTSTALGFAVAEGLLSLDDTVLSHFPELDADITDPRSRRILIRHIAAMASGHVDETLERACAADPVNLVRGFLLTPPDAEPGTVFAYNQPCTYSLAAIVTRAAGQHLTEYLRPRLLDPLGITEVGWLRDASGQELGFSGLHATTDAVARLGLLYLQRGVWQGRQLLSREWVEQATRRQVDNGQQSEPDWQQGYGFQFWMSRHGFRADGAYGQFGVVLPEQDAVLAMTAATEDMQGILDAAWQHLLPAFQDGALTSASAQRADAVLADRLTTLELPVVAAAPAPPPEIASAWDGFSGPAAAEGPVAAVSLAWDGQGWLITLTDGGSPAVPLDVRLGTSGWAVCEPALPDGGTIPIATSGGWADRDTLRFDVLFLETPHRLEVSCSLPQGSSTAVWATDPLHPSPLHQMRSPRYRAEAGSAGPTPGRQP